MLGDPYVLVLLQDDSRETDLVRHFIDAVAFISDAPLSVGRTLDDRYIPEDSSDRDLLDRLGSDRVYEATQAAFVSRTFYPLQIDEECVEPLLRRKAGLRLYAEALRAQTPAQEFRDLWRVQESAFRLQDDALVATLANFEPAIALGFTKTELKRLSVLRGQASHAKSRLGVDDLVRVEQECRAQMPRVKALAERVILTKKEWGSPSLAVDAIQFRPYPPS